MCLEKTYTSELRRCAGIIVITAASLGLGSCGRHSGPDAIVMPMSAPTGCEWKDGTKHRSPDGAWTARVRFECCERGYVFTSTASFNVILYPTKHPDTTVDVFNIEGSTDFERPKIVWLSNTRLRIFALSPNYSTIIRTGYRNITISYRFSQRRPRADRPAEHSQKRLALPSRSLAELAEAHACAPA